ncbi:MAG: cell division protein SepF [Lachnospiraceae bacterium]|nr:cell division protein SepF [Lachnospiraceae bacterium]
MSVFSKFLDVMRLNDDEDEDYNDEDYEEEEEDQGSRSFSLRNSRKAEETDDASNEESDEHDSKSSRFDHKVTTNRSGSKITPLRSKKGNGEMSVCVFKPTDFNDAMEIAETLISNQTVIVNMEGVDVGLAQRIIDFSSGCIYALNGNLQKISNYIFIITPAGVSISGDLQDIVNAFDFSGIQTGF